MAEKRNRDAFDFMLNRSEQPQNGHHVHEDTRSPDDVDSFLLGNRKAADHSNSKPAEQEKSMLGQLDWAEMFHHVDTLLESARELKPLFSKVKPYLDHFMDKKN